MSGTGHLILMFAEAFFLSIFLYILIRLKPWLGLSPLFVTVGSLQFVQVILAMSLYIEVFPGLLISPGSSVFFVGTILGVLLVYIVNDALSTRKLIYSLLIANVFLSLITISISQHFLGEDIHFFVDLPREVFLQHPRVMIVGTFALFIDTILVIIVYELMSNIKFLFLRILITLSLVLILDSIIFVTGVFFENEDFLNILISNITGKLLTVPFFALGIITIEKIMKRNNIHETKTIKDFFNLLTYREKFEKASREIIDNNKRFQKLTDNFPGMLYQYQLSQDGTSCFLYVSKGVEEIYEISIKDLQNDASFFFKNIHKDDIDMIDSTLKDSAKKLKDWNIEYRIDVPKKGLCWLRSHSKPEKLDDGTIIWYGAVTDITNLKTIEIDKNKKEQLLFQQSKMAAMGEMLGNIAHQWRQPLSTISSASTGAKLQKEMDCLSDSQLNSALTAINASAQYLSQTIEDFRSFFNPNNNKTSEINILDTIDKTLKLVKSQFVSKDIEIIQKIENYKLLTIDNELVQVLINILNNAKDALLKVEDQKRYIFINTYKDNSNFIIEIKDSAKGIPKDIINRVFEPYFTTKHQSVGTGIGLYMSQEIINNHLGGTLTVSNETYSYDGLEYTGANFLIKIPMD